MISEGDLFEFAQKVAAFYCRKNNRWDDYDDAVQIHIKSIFFY